VATREELANSLEGFCDACNADDRLRELNHDWNRRISINANDMNVGFTITYRDGIAEVREGAPDDADLRVESDCETLTSIFYGEMTPAEPYATGELKLLGSEDDILRLDATSLLIWGE
jgi:putative sterol carrier protein